MNQFPPIRAVSNFFENSRRYSQFTGVNDTGGKWKKSSIRIFLIILFGPLWVEELTYIYIFAWSLILFPLFAPRSKLSCIVVTRTVTWLTAVTVIGNRSKTVNILAKKSNNKFLDEMNLIHVNSVQMFRISRWRWREVEQSLCFTTPRNTSWCYRSFNTGAANQCSTSWCWCYRSVYLIDASATGQCTSWCWCYWSVYFVMLVLLVSVLHDAGAAGQCTSRCWCYWSMYFMMLVLQVSVQYAGATSQCKHCTSLCQCCWSV